MDTKNEYRNHASSEDNGSPGPEGFILENVENDLSQKTPGEEISEKVSQTPTSGLYLTKYITNIRSQPDTYSKIIRTIPAGTYLTVIATTEEGDWIKVDDGWVKLQYLKKS